jgi:hypothetical protein
MTKKSYQKPMLVRRENLIQIAAQVNQNGNALFLSPVVREVLIDNA